MTEVDGHKWYVAVLVVAVRVDDCDAEDPSVDIQCRLLRAADAESAYQRALAIGAKQSTVYKNAKGADVRWEFVGLQDLQELSEAEPNDGPEVYSFRMGGSPEQLVVPKERLWVFWYESNKDRTAAELLEEMS